MPQRRPGLARHRMQSLQDGRPLPNFKIGRKALAVFLVSRSFPSCSKRACYFGCGLTPFTWCVAVCAVFRNLLAQNWRKISRFVGLVFHRTELFADPVVGPAVLRI